MSSSYGELQRGANTVFSGRGRGCKSLQYSLLRKLDQSVATYAKSRTIFPQAQELNGTNLEYFTNTQQLVLQLYQPGASEKVGKTQEALQNLQRSPEGWQLANSLLGNEAESVRFFGALTFIVKLNTDSWAIYSCLFFLLADQPSRKSLSDDDAEALLQTLIGWLIRRLENGEGALVVRKLCSTLVAYFLQFSIAWNKCVKHLMYCLCSGQAIRYGELDDSPNTMILVQRLAPEQAVVIFWFASNLVEEVGKTDSNSMKQLSLKRVGIYELVLTYCPDTNFMTMWCLTLTILSLWSEDTSRLILQELALEFVRKLWSVSRFVILFAVTFSWDQSSRYCFVENNGWNNNIWIWILTST